MTVSSRIASKMNRSSPAGWRSGAAILYDNLQNGTAEAKRALYDECDVILECKSCRELFRDVSKFITHKRDFCRSAPGGSFSQQQLSSDETLPVPQELAAATGDEEVNLLDWSPTKSSVTSTKPINTARPWTVPETPFGDDVTTQQHATPTPVGDLIDQLLSMDTYPPMITTAPQAVASPVRGKKSPEGHDGRDVPRNQPTVVDFGHTAAAAAGGGGAAAAAVPVPVPSPSPPLPVAAVSTAVPVVDTKPSLDIVGDADDDTLTEDSAPGTERAALGTRILDSPRADIATSRAASEVTSTPPFETASDGAVESLVAQTEALNIAGATADYRDSIVAKGSGNTEDCCQFSVSLSACRGSPLECSLSHAVNPSLFWIQLFNSNIDNIDDEMMRALETNQIALSHAKVGDYCAAPVEEDPDVMHRAKILEMKENPQGMSFAKILYLDTGKIDWVSVLALLEMPERLRHFQRQACPCALAEVEPVSGVWEESVTTSFRELCATDDTWHLAVKSLDQTESPAINTVALYRVKNGDMSKMETLLIRLIGVSKGRVRRTDRQVPTKAIQTEGGAPIGGRDPPNDSEGWRCTVRVMENTEEQSEDETRETAMRQPVAELPRPLLVNFVLGNVQPLALQNAVGADGMIYFHVTEVVSPWEFYIQIRDRNRNNEPLDRLERQMNTFYSVPANQMLLSAGAPSQFAVVQYPVDGRTSFRRILARDWNISDGNQNRDIRVNSTVMATFVDEGFCKRLPTGRMYALAGRFCVLPAQAAFCKLYECIPATASNIWDPNAIDIFKSLTTQGKPLMKALVMTDKQPYELIVIKIERNGSELNINARMVESAYARSYMDWSV